MAKPENRQNHLAAIHIAQKALGLSPDDACALKLAITGKASAGDMSAPQRRQYLAHLSGLQGKRGGGLPRVARNDDLDERWYKARALWAALAKASQVHTDTDAALMAYVKRQTHLEHWRFLNGHQVNSVIEALKRWCVRTGVATQPVAGAAKA